MPDQPEINDTLGWVYYKKKMGRTATQYLAFSVAKDDGNAVYQFHLGMAYAQVGEDGKARRLLEKALSTNPNFDGSVEARKTLKTLITDLRRDARGVDVHESKDVAADDFGVRCSSIAAPRSVGRLCW